MKIDNFDKALGYLYTKIRRGAKQKFPGELGVKRIKYLLMLLGDPQEKVKVIHTAGTSGKGSTCFFIANLLISQGFKVGLHLSPHLLDIRERFSIDNKLISKEKFVDYLNEIIPYVERVAATEYETPTYFEVLVSLAFYIFYKERVDYAVIETGLGGLLDGTNCIKSKDKVCVITRLGIDHKRVLGKRIRDIAYQKAGIIQDQNKVFSTWQNSAAREVIEKVIKEKEARLTYAKEGVNFRNIRLTPKNSLFDFYSDYLSLKRVELKMLGKHQIENCSLALLVFGYLSSRDRFKVNKQKIYQVLSIINFAGRLEVFNIEGKKVIVDGAHNPQKMKSLTTTLKIIYPDEKFIFLLAFKIGKDYTNVLKYILPLAKKVVITDFGEINQDMADFAQDPKIIGDNLSKMRFNNFSIIVNPEEALRRSLKLNGGLVVTGSLYLISSLYSDIRKKNV